MGDAPRCPSGAGSGCRGLSAVAATSRTRDEARSVLFAYVEGFYNRS